MERELNDQEKVRRQKMEDLRAKGIDPFGQAFERTANSKSIRDEFGEASKEELEAKNVEVKIAGRIMSKRRMGKMCFMHVLDKDGQIQLVINKAMDFPVIRQLLTYHLTNYPKLGLALAIVFPVGVLLYLVGIRHQANLKRDIAQCIKVADQVEAIFNGTDDRHQSN